MPSWCLDTDYGEIGFAISSLGVRMNYFQDSHKPSIEKIIRETVAEM